MTSKESNKNSNNKYKLTLYSFSHPYDPLTGSVSSFRDYSFEPIFEINTQQQHLRSHLCWDGKKILICIQDTSQNNPCLMYADSVNYFSHWTYVYPDGKSQSQGQGSSFQLNSYITTYDISFEKPSTDFSLNEINGGSIEIICAKKNSVHCPLLA